MGIAYGQTILNLSYLHYGLYRVICNPLEPACYPLWFALVGSSPQLAEAVYAMLLHLLHYYLYRLIHLCRFIVGSYLLFASLRFDVDCLW